MMKMKHMAVDAAIIALLGLFIYGSIASFKAYFNSPYIKPLYMHKDLGYLAIALILTICALLILLAKIGEVMCYATEKLASSDKPAELKEHLSGKGFSQRAQNKNRSPSHKT